MVFDTGLAHVNGFVGDEIPVLQRDDPMLDGLPDFGRSTALETRPFGGLQLGPDPGGAEDPMPPILFQIVSHQLQKEENEMRNMDSKPKAKRSGDGFRYFNELQIKLIRCTARDAAPLAEEKGPVTAVRDWRLIDLLTSTGMREAEVADMRSGDILAGYGQSTCYV
jgi:hypothetical protein